MKIKKIKNIVQNKKITILKKKMKSKIKGGDLSGGGSVLPD